MSDLRFSSFPCPNCDSPTMFTASMGDRVSDVGEPVGMSSCSKCGWKRIEYVETPYKIIMHSSSDEEVTGYVTRFNRDVMFSSKSGDWNTPIDLYNWLDDLFHFTLDPCTTEDNPLGTPKFYTLKEDGLKQSWKGERVYINPPYGRIYPIWVRKAYKEVTENDCELVVMLLPARTDTIVFHDYCTKGEIWFLKGRLHFSGHENPAPFPSMLVIFRND